MEHITHALARAFNVAPTNDEASNCANSRGPEDHQTHSDFASDGAAVKRQANLTAELALLGYTLHELSDRTFLVCRWDRSRTLVDLHAVASFLRQAGGSA